ncbi:MAG: hypothetical protein C0407_08010 [Desulfobacca sp.]|nr:hypothetical protein [Desulfobacca sp.]
MINFFESWTMLDGVDKMPRFWRGGLVQITRQEAVQKDLTSFMGWVFKKRPNTFFWNRPPAWF